MSKFKLAVYPQDKYRFALYDNTRRLTWQQIKAETGCCALVNLWYFGLMDYTHQAAVMLDGQLACKPTYDWPGICVDRDGRVTTGWIKDAVWAYAASVQADYIAGKRTNTTAWGRNGVTYTGLKADGTVVLMLAPKDTGLTSAEAVRAMRDAGCVDILRWDGSWSSQGSLGPGMDVQPSQRRICRGWLLVYPRENKKEDKPVEGITRDYMTRNRCYTSGRAIKPKGIMVHSTAMPGVMAKALRDRWDSTSAEVSVHAIIDPDHTLQVLPWTARAWHCGNAYKGGPTANDTHIAFEICEPPECRLLPVEWATLAKGSKGWAVERLQRELVARGYDPKGVDGSFGAGCEAALRACQKALGLAVDGRCGKGTLAALAQRDGSFMAYDPKDTQAYFDAVCGRAVALCAYLCREYGLDPIKDILCHSEGYAKGIASNHADVMHWFPRHGESMDCFRAAVKAALAGETADPFAAAVDKLTSAGIITTPGYWTTNDTYDTGYVRTLIERCADKL